MKIKHGIYHPEDFSWCTDHAKEGREKYRYYCLKGEFSSMRILDIKVLSGVASLLGLLALRPASESVDTRVA